MSIEIAGKCANCGRGLMNNDDDVRVVGKDIYCDTECLRDAGVAICDNCGDYIDLGEASFGVYFEKYCKTCFEKLDDEDKQALLEEK